MKKFYAMMSAALLVFSLSVSAQFPMQSRGGRPGGQMPTGHLYGKVVDASNKGVEAASVTLLTTRMDSATKKPKEVIVGGMLTDKNGYFSVKDLPLMGRYQLQVSGIGFTPIQKQVGFDLPNREALASGDMSSILNALDKDLGNIKLEVDEKALSNVTVTAARPTMTLGIDRKIFNVDRNIVSAGGTAVDVMRNVPSINVDIEGNVTLRNAAPTIFVDGRPTTMTLDQIPADAIESVEIITNPSAKYDASGGMAGILNIVMKKNRRIGYSGNVRANLDSRARVGLGGDINMRQNKVNLFASGMYNQRKSIATGTTERTTRTFTDTSLYSFQRDRDIRDGYFAFGRFGMDYFMDIRNTFTVSASLVRGNFMPEGTANIYIDTLKGGNLVSQAFQRRLTNSDGLFRNKGLQFSYKHLFPQAGHEITADVTYNEGRNENDGTIVSENYRLPGMVFQNRYNQLQLTQGTNENVTLQTDYIKPLSANSKLEAGARVQIRNIASQNTITIASRENTILYNSKDAVYAAYATFSNRIQNFGYQLGLRAESSIYEGVLPLKNQTFNIDFPISLFPSVFLSQRLKGDDEMQFNYSRRINRPIFFQLFPFTDYSDSLNFSRGNPGLQPEFTNSFELSFSKIFKNRDNLLLSVYYKNTNNLITPIQTREFDSVVKGQILINTYENANSSYVSGLEIISRNKVTKFWEIAANANLFTAKIDLTDQPDPEQLVSYFLKLNNTFKLPKNFSLQLSGDYQSKTITPPGGRGLGGGGGFSGRGGWGGGPQSAAQGFIRPNYGVDAAIRFEFLKNRVASLSLNVNDIFRTRLYSQYTETPFSVQNTDRRRDPQVFRLNFNYRFGKMDVSLFKRKNTRAEGNVDMGTQNF